MVGFWRDENGSGNAVENAPSGKDGQAAQQVKLYVLTNRFDLIENGVFQKYADQFAQRNPGVSVQFEGIQNYASDIMLRLSTRNVGDVLLLPNNIKNEALPDYFEPLNDSMFENIHFADFKAYSGSRYGIATGASTTGIVFQRRWISFMPLARS